MTKGTDLEQPTRTETRRAGEGDVGSSVPMGSGVPSLPTTRPLGFMVWTLSPFFINGLALDLPSTGAEANPQPSNQPVPSHKSTLGTPGPTPGVTLLAYSGRGRGSLHITRHFHHSGDLPPPPALGPPGLEKQTSHTVTTGSRLRPPRKLGARGPPF